MTKHKAKNSSIQSIIELSMMANQNLQDGKYTAAVEQFEQLLLIYQSSGHKHTKDLASISSQLSHLYFILSNEDKAIQYLENTLRICASNEANIVFDSLRVSELSLYGRILLQNNKLTASQAKLEEALSIYTDNEDDLLEIHKGVILIELSRVFYQQKKYTRALKFAQEALQINLDDPVMRKDELAIATLHFEISRSFMALKDYVSAAKECELALGMYRHLNHHLPEKNTFLALYHLATIYDKDKKESMAVAKFEKAQEMCDVLFQKYPDDVDLKHHCASTQYYLGRYYSNAKKYVQSIAAFEQALPLLAQQKRHDELAATLSALGHMYLTTGHLKAAQEKYEYLLQEYSGSSSHTLGDNPIIVQAMDELSCIYMSQDDIPKAMEFFHNQNAIFHRLNPTLSNQIAPELVIEKEGDMHYEQKDYVRSILKYRFALAMHHYPSERSLVIGTLLKKTGDVYFAKEQYSQAQTTYQAALDNVRRVYLTEPGNSENTKLTADILQKLGDISSKQGNYPDATHFYQYTSSPVKFLNGNFNKTITQGVTKYGSFFETTTVTQPVLNVTTGVGFIAV